MQKETRHTDQTQQHTSIQETDQTIEVLRRQMYQRIANGHALEIAEEQAKRDQS